MSLSLPSVRRFPFPTDPDARGDRRARRNALWLILNALLIKRKPWREDYWWVGIKGNRFTATTSAGHALPPKATHADLGCRQTGGVILHLRTCSRARCVRWSEVRLRRGVLGLDSGGTGPPSCMRRPRFCSGPTRKLSEISPVLARCSGSRRGARRPRFTQGRMWL